MNEKLFAQLRQVLHHAESVTFQVTALEDGRLRVCVLPRLKESPEEDKDASLRAALALPLIVTDSPERLDAGFLDLLTEYARQRSALGLSLASLDALKDANRQAASKVSREKKKQAKAPEAKTAPASPPSPAKAAEETPASTKSPASAVALSDDDLLL